MDQLRAQLGNYLEWLESRGLTGPVAYRAPADAPAQPEISHMDINTTEPHAGVRRSMMEDHHVDVRSAETLRTSPAAPATATAPAPFATGIPAPVPAPTPSTPQREAGMPWKVGFYSSSDLTEEEFIMVSKIALALGLPAEDFKIWAEDSLVRVPVDLLRCSYIVALGPGSGQTLLALGQTVAMNSIQKALQGAPLVTIPHPRAMLKEPALKSGAWAALQKFKNLMKN